MIHDRIFKPFHQLHNWQPTGERCDGYTFQRHRSAKLRASHRANSIVAAHAERLSVHIDAKLAIFTTASRHRRFVLNPDLIWFTYCLSETMCTVCVGGDRSSAGLSRSFCLVADNKSSHFLQWSKCSFFPWQAKICNRDFVFWYLLLIISGQIFCLWVQPVYIERI